MVIYVHLQMVKSTIRALPSQLKHTTNVRGDTHCRGQKYDIVRRLASGPEINQLAMVRSSLSSNDSALYKYMHYTLTFPPMLNAYCQCVYPVKIVDLRV